MLKVQFRPFSTQTPGSSDNNKTYSPIFLRMIFRVLRKIAARNIKNIKERIRYEKSMLRFFPNTSKIKAQFKNDLDELFTKEIYWRLFLRKFIERHNLHALGIIEEKKTIENKDSTIKPKISKNKKDKGVKPKISKNKKDKGVKKLSKTKKNNSRK